MSIKHKRSTIAGVIPAAGELGIGEIAINFADGALYSKSPSTGQVEVIADLTANNTSLEAVVAIGENPPLLNISSGKLWWDTTSGRLMIYYTDLNTSQWVEASPSAAGPQNVTVTENPQYSNLAAILVNVPNPNQGDEVFVIGQGKAIYIGSIWVRSVDEITPIV